MALGMYVAYNVAAAAASVPAGRAADRLGQRGPVLVLTVGVAGFAAAYALLAIPSPGLWALVVPFLLAGAGIGAVETAQHAAIAALAPPQLRGSAFGVLATVQSLGNLAASAAAGLLWTGRLAHSRVWLPDRMDAARDGRAAAGGAPGHAPTVPVQPTGQRRPLARLGERIPPSRNMLGELQGNGVVRLQSVSERQSQTECRRCRS
ncbi:MFS transporter [Micromonospora sp. NPDC047527]|uniref:MFS transporter n=1 Tax=unclassified Micromonospora TaxID=2617518 RepID=UPI00340E44CA